MHPHLFPFRFAKAMERLGHEIVTDTEAGQRAFDALDDGGGMAANPVERTADAQDLRLKLAGPGNVPGPGGFESRPGERGPGKVDGRRERPEKKRSTRPKPEERERGNWRWDRSKDDE